MHNLRTMIRRISKTSLKFIFIFLFTQYLKRVAQLANELFYLVALCNKQSTYIYHKLQQTRAIKITRSNVLSKTETEHKK